MVAILQKLEPIEKKAGIVLYEELDEFSEVLFFLTGSYDVGYTLNRNQHFPLRLSGS
jgi:hypothetical protein